jgi:nucleotide-binding universal stress UspA family protein
MNGMKLLVAYDGSRCSEAALDDIARAGLPENGEALVVSVAEIWLPPPTTENGTDPYIESILSKYREKGERILAEAETFAKHAHARLAKLMPTWTITHQASYGSPAWEILTFAEKMKADLIITGSHGHSALSRAVLGSVSQKILTEAPCSVRIARGRVEVDPTPIRIVLGYDASAGAEAAVSEIISRNWPETSEFRILAATDPVVPNSIGRFFPPITDLGDEGLREETAWIRAAGQKAVARFTDKGVPASFDVIEGNPNYVLVKEAESWNADCIFVGANAAGSRFERFLLGSTSAAVAARAHCSVEVVRARAKD